MILLPCSTPDYFFRTDFHNSIQNVDANAMNKQHNTSLNGNAVSLNNCCANGKYRKLAMQNKLTLITTRIRLFLYLIVLKTV